MDKVLRIYDGSSDYDGLNPVANLKYTIQGGLISYCLLDQSNYLIDSFEATIADNGEVLEVGDIWRLYSLDGTLISGGRIIKGAGSGAEAQASGDGKLHIVGRGWTGLLLDRMVDDDSWVGKGGDDIFKDILDDYFSDYTIGQTGIASPTNTITKSYDGMYAYEVLKDVAQLSYGGSDKQFDFYIYESAAGTMEAKFFERESGTPVAITTGDVRPRGFELVKREDLNFNYCKVYGATQDFNNCPTDKDLWSEGNAASWDLTDLGTISDSGTDYVGSESISLAADAATGSCVMFLELPYNATYTPSELFSDGNGFKLDFSKDQWFRCRIRINTALAGEYTGNNAQIGIQLEDEDGGLWIAWVADGETYKSGINVAIVANEWKDVDVNLSELISHTTGSPDYVKYVQVGMYNFTTDGDEEILIDGIHFHTKSGQCTGSYPANPSSPRKDFIFRDRNIDNIAFANDLAEYLVKQFEENYQGTLTLSRNNNTLKAGDSISLVYQPAGINTAITLPIQTIEWVVGQQTLYLGRTRSSKEIVDEARLWIKRSV